MRAAPDGTVQIKGLDSTDYIFTEVATSPNYQLLARPITVRLVATKPVDERPVKLETGALSHVYVWPGTPNDRPDNLSDYDLLNANADSMSTGRAHMTVSNTSVLHILRTGGNGTAMFTLLGLFMLAFAGFFYSRSRITKE